MKPHRKSNSETEDGSSNALILECSNKSSKHSKKMKVKSKPNKSVTTLSKNQQRKLRRIQEEKEKQEKWATAIEILQKNRLNEEEHALLSSSGNIGKVETMKVKLSRAMLFHKAGLEVPSDVPLFRERESHSVAVEDEDLQENGSYSVAKGSLRIDNLQDLNKKHSKILDPVCKITTGNSELDESRAMNTSKIECHNVVPLEESISNSISKVDMESKNDQKKHDGDTARKGRLDNSKSEDSGKDEKLSITDKVSTVSDSASIHRVVGTKPGRKSGDLQNCDKDKKMLASRDANDQIMSSQGCLLRRTFVVPVSRPEEVEEKRKDLPIIMMEQEIMEAVNQHPIVIICGETGCGKTTQVPQFLFEAGFGSKACKERSGVIGITQPRRVAVLATAKRVAHEMSFQLGKEVGFQVRHDRRIGEKSSIKFMTDGILLREVQSDFLLRRYSIIVLDEAHERSLNTDILIGMLSRIVPYRQKLYNEQQEELSNGKLVAPDKLISPLKLILMSATLRIEDFVTNTKLFPTSPPVVEVPTRQFPVTIHFSAKTELVDYLGKAYKKVLAIHTKLPSGGILVFVTGQREVELLCRKLRKAFVKQRNKLANPDNSCKNGKPSSISDKGSDEANLEQIAQAVDETNGDSKCMDRFELYDDDGFDAPLETHSSSSSDDYSDSDSDSEEECLVMNTSFSDPGKLFGQTDLLKQPESLTSLKAAFLSLNQETDVKSKTESAEPIIQNLKNEKQKDLNSDSGPKVPGPLHVLPLYALLPAASQLCVFSKIPEGERLVVVATNVAETSITIPGIKYVVDCGRAKVKEYNNKSGIARYEIQWISKASAAQRAGRAGRTGPGHCYRLYSSAVFNNTFMDFPVPEIVKAPIEGIILLLNNMNINKVTNFPFPTPPEGSAIKEGIKCLESLSALTQKGMMTPLGKAMVLFPISPRHSCMLLTTIRIVKGLRKCDGTNVVLAFAIAVAAALSMDNPFLTDFGSSSLKDVTENEIDRKMSEEENLNKKQRASARNTQRAFENASSDPLTVVNVLHSFEFVANKEEFCRVNYLHFKTMDEMSKLRKQLMHVVFHQKMDVECEQFNWSFGTLFDVERAWREHRGSLKLIHEDILRQAVCAGWVDRIAKRVKSNKISKVLPEDQRIKAIRYQSCSVDEIIYLHPSSSTAKAAPDFVVYNELVETKRLYMRGVTSVNKDWLVLHGKALCSFSKPLADPEPEYDSLLDEVFCWVSPTFGTRNWELPLHRAIIESTEERVRVFACALLQGKVLPCLNAIQRCLAADPVIIRKPESVVHKRVSELLYRLNSRPIAVDNRAKLRSVLGEDSKFLYSELLLWLQSNFRPIFDKLWEKVNLEIKLEHRELYPKRSKKSDSARDWY